MANEILVIDDNLDIRELISGILKDQGMIVREAANFDQALLEINKKLPDVAVIDVKLDKGDNDGIELLVHLKKIDEDVPVIMISGHANVQMAVDSLKLGAFEFIQKPFSSERLLNFTKRAAENINLKKERKDLESKLFHSYDIIGQSQAITKVRNLISKLGNAESRVFISGPAGSGKTVLAVEAVCREAALTTMRAGKKTITKAHFGEAIGRVRPTVTPEMLEYYSKMEQSLTSGLESVKRQKDSLSGIESV